MIMVDMFNGKNTQKQKQLNDMFLKHKQKRLHNICNSQYKCSYSSHMQIKINIYLDIKINIHTYQSRYNKCRDHFNNFQHGLPYMGHKTILLIYNYQTFS